MLVIVSSLGAMSGIILAGPRVYYAMAEDRLLFQWMGAIHPRFRTPTSRSLRRRSGRRCWCGRTYGTIVSRVICTEWIFFAALALGVMVLRRSGSYAPAFRARVPVAPVLRVTCAAIVVVKSCRIRATAFGAWRSSPRASGLLDMEAPAPREPGQTEEVLQGA
jgi:APA family basic amino acid/polyamine antiporter